MRFAKFCTFLILLTSAFAWARPYLLGLENGIGQSYEVKVKNPMTSFQVSEASSQRAYFENQIVEARLQLKSLRQPQQRVDLLKKILSRVEDWRNQRPMADTEEEVYMNIITHSIMDLPSGSAFSPNHCDFYRRDLLIYYEPTAVEGNPIEDPAVAQAMDLINVICT